MGFLTDYQRDLFNVIGLLIGLVGLGYAIYLAKSAKTAAEQARAAAQSARDRIFSLDTLKELTRAKLALNEIIRLQRLNAADVPWEIVLERYGTARESFVRCENASDVPESQRQALAEALFDLRIMVEDIETACAAGGTGNLNTVRFNQVLARQMDDLERARLAIERAE